MQAETHYALSGDVHIAYQVTGSGPIDKVDVPGYITHVELQWQLPSYAPVLDKESERVRLIRFDKRGTGMSDPVHGVPTLETRMDDVRAVLDAVGSPRAALYGLAEGVALSVLFAATYPQRTAALVLRSGSPRTMWAPDYPWGWTEEQFAAYLRRSLQIFGPRSDALAAVNAVGDFSDEEAAAFLDFQRRSISPGALEALIRMNREIDIRPVLPAVHVPTLVLHGAEDEVIPVEVAEYMAAHIPGARLEVIAGAGHLAVGEAAQRITDAADRFLMDVWQSGGWDADDTERILVSVLFIDIVDSTPRALELGDRAWAALLQSFYTLVRQQLMRYRGREIDTAGDGLFAAFDGPARAIQCALSVVERVASLGVSVRAGVHTGECEVLDGKPAGIAVHTGARVPSHAGPAEVLVSATVKDLVAGSGLRFSELGQRALKGLPEPFTLYKVVTSNRDGT